MKAKSQGLVNAFLVFYRNWLANGFAKKKRLVVKCFGVFMLCLFMLNINMISVNMLMLYLCYAHARLS